MATRTVRLDDEAEAALRQIRDATGLPISERGRGHGPDRRKLDLGPGGYAIAPSTSTRRGVVDAVRRKLKR